jgi:prolipoprotein diacylglyceryl transferase
VGRIPLLVPTLIASIPSPHSGVVHAGPLTIHLYGLMLLIGIVACVWLTGVRWVRWGGDWDLIFRVAVWGVAFGIVGARLYHDITSWNEVPDHWWGFAAVWQGGLGVWGGIALGVAVGAIIVRRSGNSVRLMMDAVAPGLLLAQGIGRLGNYFNQELFGKPTSLPWGLEISPSHRPDAYLTSTTFHPTFLYELIWDLLGVGVLLLVDSRFRLRRPALFALYVSWYTAFRTYEETLRIDPAHHFLGQRINFWVSLVLFVLSTAFFVWWQFVRKPSEERGSPGRRRARPRPVPTGPTMAVPKGRGRPR